MSVTSISISESPINQASLTGLLQALQADKLKTLRLNEEESSDYQDRNLEDDDEETEFKVGGQRVRGINKEGYKEKIQSGTALIESYQRQLEKASNALKETDRIAYPSAYKSLKEKVKELQQTLDELNNEQAKKMEDYNSNYYVSKKKSESQQNREKLDKLDVTINMYVNGVVMGLKNNKPQQVDKFLNMSEHLKQEISGGIAYDVFASKLEKKLFENNMEEKYWQHIKEKTTLENNQPSAKMKM